ncbi:MAG: type IV-A pilus assembly ATPase PilB [Candidatus Wallbacteria bacterium GWC2_49_35]|uniref:Type IV-A pilus assembly ATPase PilB n=1 Tax=Candidatus Wallbacteria bacterium GWC2_49_35 TaxID=1817813 RepID=A0A1F7WNX6_9BACT|nr:MAG: type IV-A pilus assembly ATPase PilB [Candidatus Wallbacteria bacterium GWC2_49_35]HBC76188.1 type IV-A pilus assembly ATPase PilB [Candidatus Wallbacteria bacterium]
MVEPKKRLRLGDALLQDGLVNEEQLQKALEIQKQSGKRLGAVLVEMGVVTENDIVTVLGKQLGIPYINLSNYLIDPATVRIIPENIARRHQLIPINKVGNKLTVAMVDPLNILAIDDIQFMTGLVVKPVVATSTDINEALNNAYGNEGKMDELMEDLGDIGKDANEGGDLGNLEELDENDAPIIRLVNLVISNAVTEGVSDIHIEPFDKDIRIRYRLDGDLRINMEPPKRAQAAITSRVKIMSQLDIAEKRLPQDGRIKIKVNNRPIDLRVATIPTVWGEKIVMRILDQSNLKLDLTDLGFEPRSLEKFMAAIAMPNGIVLVTGPTGSGKTTTLYSALHTVNQIDVNVMTAEDPVEYNLHGINQVQCKAEIGLTFAAALRSFLRLDPDVIMVGEIRDFETCEIAVKASLTGHLVLSTLHTNDAPSTIGRLLNMGIEPFMVATSLILVQAQRLVKVICKDCKIEYKPKPDILKALGITPELLVKLELPHLNLKNLLFYKGKGCEKCGGKGYKGRVGIYEVMAVSDNLRRMILDRASTLELKEAAHNEGMLTLRESAIRKVLLGKTTVDEVFAVTA